MAFMAVRTLGGSERREAGQVELLHLMYFVAEELKTDAPHVSLTPMISSFEDFFFWGLQFINLFDEFGTELVPLEHIKQAVPSALADAGITEDARGLWPILPELYGRWLEILAERSVWTRGEKYRISAQHIDDLECPFPQIYLAGFAALNRAEEKVFSTLTRLGVARVVIQDGPSSLIGNTRWENMDRLRSVCQGEWDIEIPESQDSVIKFYQGFDLHSQIHMAEHLFDPKSNESQGIAPDQETIVLPRPEPLIPVLTQLLEDTAVPYNISMGYPLERTAIVQLIDSIFKAQEGKVDGKYYVPNYLAVLRHPYIKNIRGKNTGDSVTDIYLKSVTYFLENWLVKEKKSFVTLEDLEKAAIPLNKKDFLFSQFLSHVHQICFTVFESLEKIGELASALKRMLKWTLEYGTATNHPFSGEFMTAIMSLLDELETEPISKEKASIFGLHSLFSHLVRQTRIPFRGIPLEGLQILGFLETRCLKFKRVMIFDLNEGILPPESKPDPVLPPDLRRYLGLPDQRRMVEVIRYHFHRFLAGAQEIHLFFSEDKGQLKSRFVEELIWEAEKRAGCRDVIPIHHPVASPRTKIFSASPVEKRPLVLDFLSSFTFSATALDTYISCPFRFYAKYVLGLDLPDTIDKDEIDPLAVGNLVHGILRDFYSSWLNKQIQFDADIEEGLRAKSDSALKEVFGPRAEWSGGVRLFREVLLYRLSNFLRLERKYAQGHLLMGLEVPCAMDFHVRKDCKVRFKGALDRVEKDKQGCVWVIDYKTGSKIKLPRATLNSKLSTREEIKQHVVSFQLPAYLLLCAQHFNLRSEWSEFNAALYGLKGLTKSSDLNTLRYILFKQEDNQDKIMRLYVKALKTIIEEILNPKIPFDYDPSDYGYCSSCPYHRQLCKVG
jgi:hypothetical protein